MSSKIRVLSEQTINKIAAGEVIENPASVVKELVENSLDAGATDICIEIKGGGRQLIRISDNGCGMNADDALLCLERHATSKIRELEDIHSIDTMGFRGEAIPSIAAISKFTLITCPQGAEINQGTMVIVEGGKILQCAPVARSPGTTIEVKALFFNVPVRKKFQKSPAFDSNEILKMVSSIALGYPDVKFQLISDQKIILTTSVPSNPTFEIQLKNRIKEVLGADFADSTCYLSTEQDEYKIQGYIGLPSYTRHNRTGQFLFINQRAVFVSLLSFATRLGYGTTLPTNRHPVFVLHLTIPGMLVDVNVHPQKREVRLRQDFILKDMLVNAVSKALQTLHSQDPFPEVPSPPPHVFIPPPKLPENRPPVISTVKPSTPATTASTTLDFSKYSSSQTAPKAISSAQQTLFTPSQQNKPPRVLATLPRFIVLDATTVHTPSSGDGLCIVDQRAAHSRIIFEELLKRSQKRLSVQQLLIPHTFEATPIESALLSEHLEDLNQLGISIHQSGAHTYMLDALPTVLGDTDIHELLRQLIEQMRDNLGHDYFKQEKDKVIATAASRAAISRNKQLPLEAAQAMINQLWQCQTQQQCPLGKPILSFVRLEELERKFQRVSL